MENNSRLITYPSVEPKITTTLLLIDILEEELDQVVLYLQAQDKNFDVYLYRGSIHDLEWLYYVGGRSDAVLIQDSSQVTSNGAIRVGVNQTYARAVDYICQMS